MASTQTRSLEIATLTDLPAPSFVPIRYRPGNLGTWSGHLAFANDLIADFRPSLLVELGTHWGESYFTFCQSVFQNGVDCLCYAVDHWLGEPHAGHYGEEVFQDVQSFNETHYRGFSYLLRTGFDEALQQFADDSIDLLHIDGLHTYEAVSQDFHTWLPKVKPGGIILMHDIDVRHADFGVWRLWDELKQEFPRNFTFHHWWGLGVLQKPGALAPSAFLDLLFHSSPAMAERIRRHYLMQTAYLENTQSQETKNPTRTVVAQRSSDAAQTAGFQIYRCGIAGYSEGDSISQATECNEWKDLHLAMPLGTGAGPIRIDPSDCISVIEIRKIAITEDATGRLLFSASEAEDFKAFQFSESAVPFRGNAACCLFSCSTDPYMVLPAEWQTDKAVHLEISMQIETTLSAGVQAFQQAQAGNAAELKSKLEEALMAATARSTEEIGRLRRELAESESKAFEYGAQSERLEEVLAATTSRVRQEMQREVRILQELLDNAEDRVKEEAQKGVRLPGIEEELAITRAAWEGDRELLEQERALRAKMLQSKSWTLTKPLRGLARMIKG